MDKQIGKENNKTSVKPTKKGYNKKKIIIDFSFV